MIIYVYNKCSTCKAALRFLEQQNIKVVQREITEQTPTREELERMLTFLNGDLRKLFNTSGMLYKELKLSEKFSEMTKEKAFDLLTSNGMLVKRPFLIGKKIGLVGFKESIWKELIINLSFGFICPEIQGDFGHIFAFGAEAILGRTSCRGEKTKRCPKELEYQANKPKTQVINE